MLGWISDARVRHASPVELETTSIATPGSTPRRMRKPAIRRHSFDVRHCMHMKLKMDAPTQKLRPMPSCGPTQDN